MRPIVLFVKNFCPSAVPGTPHTNSLRYASYAPTPDGNFTGRFV